MPSTRIRVQAPSKWTAIMTVLFAITLATVGFLSGSGASAGASTVVTTAAVHGGASSVTGTLASFYRPPNPLPYAPAGSIIRSAPISIAPGLPTGTRTYRVLFHTTSRSGGDLAESGVVVVPGGTPPPGGFPIVSWAHGTTGVASGCAPSLNGASDVPDLGTLVSNRNIVVAADYRGLGAPGRHPYLVGNSEAEDVLDGARAARSLVGSKASNAVVVVGFSQGGQAALFAGEIAQSYAPELFLAGVAAVAPVTSVLELAPTGNLPPPSGQSAFTAMVLFAWSQQYRTFGLSSVLTPAGMAGLSTVSTTCVDGIASLFDAVAPSRYFLPGWEQDPAVQAANEANRPGVAPTSAPILIVQGTADEVVPYGQTTSFVNRQLCRNQYDTVQYAAEPGVGHRQALDSSTGMIDRWIESRFTGAPMVNSCTVPGLGITHVN